jgi:amidase
MQTTAGSLAKFHCFKRCLLVKKAERIWCNHWKTNLSEWLIFDQRNVFCGVAEVVRLKIPIFDHNPCGSSAGSGNGCFCHLCVVAIEQKQMVLLCVQLR